jgi:hypothetical protein
MQSGRDTSTFWTLLWAILQQSRKYPDLICDTMQYGRDTSTFWTLLWAILQQSRKYPDLICDTMQSGRDTSTFWTLLWATLQQSRKYPDYMMLNKRMTDELGTMRMRAVMPDLYYPGICPRTIQEAVASFRNTGTFLPVCKVLHARRQ